MTEPFEVSDENLVGRAVRNARDSTCRKGIKHPRWVAVADTFAVGSTYARLLCEKYHCDPDQMVKR